MLIASCFSGLSVGRTIVSYGRLGNGSKRNRFHFFSLETCKTSPVMLCSFSCGVLVTPSSSIRPKRFKHFTEVSGMVTVPLDFDKTHPEKAQCLSVLEQ